MNITSKRFVHNENAVYYFKKEHILETLEKSILRIFAETRYKLYVNGTLVAAGPCKSASAIKYYDELDVTEYLIKGKNTLEVTVLQLADKPFQENYWLMESILRSGNMLLSIWGNIGNQKIMTDENWLVAKEVGLEFFHKPEFDAYNVAALSEKVSPAYRKQEWERAITAGVLYDMGKNETFSQGLEYPVKKRTVPMMFFQKRDFVGQKNGIFDAGELTCGYIRLTVKGKGKLRLTYAECMAFRENNRIIKRKRDDENGVIIGNYDIVEVDGECSFEPFWIRTFRYVKAETEGKVIIEKIDYIETGYPISISDSYDFGNERDNRLFEISVNTLKRCMHETYVDCPYYEQLQYTMDTHLQMLFTYQLSDDWRLAEKAIDDFAQSYRAGGLTQSRYPVITPQYIPGFSLFFVLMLDEHFKRFDNKRFIQKYLPVADGIVDWFIKRLDGYMVPRSNLWDFIDWAKEYGKETGMIPSKEPIAVYSLMLAFALQRLCDMHRRLGRSIPEYAEFADRIKKDVKVRCFDEGKGLYADSPEKSHFSQHPQIWAVLCDLETEDCAKQILKKAMSLTCKATAAYLFFLFRALEKADLYDIALEYMDSLKEVIDLGCTTMPEWVGEDARSECHAWSAIAIYEFTAKILGVTYQNHTVYIAPYIKGRASAKGTVATPVGTVYCEWKKEKDTLFIKLKIPYGAKANLRILEDTPLDIKSGEYTFRIIS